MNKRYELIDFKGVDLEVEYFYSPPEKPTREYPGAPMCIEVSNVKVKDTDITSLISDADIQAIEAQISEILND
jgi:hypothetical protein